MTDRQRYGQYLGLPPFPWTPKLRRSWRLEVFHDEAEAI